MKKNVASQTVCFEMLSTTDGSAVTSGTPTVYVTGDGGTQGTGSGTSTHEGNGCWSYVPAQSETNYSHIAFTMVLSGAFNQTVNVYTTFPQTVDNNTILANGTYGLSALKTLIDTIDGIVDTILTDTGTTLDGKIDTIDGIVDAIKSVTDNLPDSGALSSLATAANLATVDGIVDSILEDTGTTLDTLVKDIPTNAELASAFTEIKGATWSGTDTLENILNEVLSTQSAAGDAVTAIGTVSGKVDNVIDDTEDIQTQIGTAGAGLTSLPDVSVDEIKASALADLFNTDSGTDSASAVSGSVVKEIVDNAGGSSLTAGDIADAVWDEDITDHTTTDSTGEALGSAVSGGVSAGTIAGAVWDAATSSYVDAGSFGKLVNDNIDAPLSTIDTVVDGIQTDLSNGTDGLGALKALIDACSTHSAADVWSVATRVLTAGTNLNDLSAADVAAELETYDAVKRSEATTDKNTITSAITTAHSTTDDLVTTADTAIDLIYGIVNSGTFGNSALKDLLDALPASGAIADAVLDEVLADLEDNSLNTDQDITPRKAIRALFNRFYRKAIQTSTAQTVFNDSDEQIATMVTSDDGETQTKGAAT